jgi:hypothetical protein
LNNSIESKSADREILVETSVTVDANKIIVKISDIGFEIHIESALGTGTTVKLARDFIHEIR